MSEMFKMKGVIQVDNEQAENALKQTGESADGLSTRLGSALSKAGWLITSVGRAAASGVVAAGKAVIGLSQQAIQGYADYEQLIGGVETLFGTNGLSLEQYAEKMGKSVEKVADQYWALQDAQDTVILNADEAWMKQGMSANDYLETVTAFSASLVASLKGDTVAAAQVADMAMTDIADNSNKMGTNMDAIRFAYQGFAKQNYTMLDNLKLGYGGTKTEMERLLKDAQAISGVKYDISSYSDVVKAIHVIQTNMGITGTTAQEAAHTISGSVNAMKAAWTNFLVGMADDNANFEELVDNMVTSILNVANNLIPRIQILLPRIVAGLNALFNSLLPYLPGMINAILPTLIEAAGSLINALISALPAIIMILAEQLPTILTTVVNSISAIFPDILAAVGELVMSLVGALPSILASIGQALVNAWQTVIYPAIQNIFKAVFGVELPDWDKVKQSIIDGWDSFKGAVENLFHSLFGVEMPTWQEIVKSISDLWDNVKQGISSFFKTIFGVGTDDSDQTAQRITNWWGVTSKTVGDIFTTVFNVTTTLYSTVAETIKNWWGTVTNTVGNIFTTVFNVTTKAPLVVWENIKLWWELVKNNFTGVFQTTFKIVKDSVETVWGTIKLWWTIIKSKFGNTFQTTFKIVKDAAVDVWNTIKLWWTDVSGRFGNTFQTLFSVVNEAASGVISRIKSWWNDTVKPFLGLSATVNVTPHYSNADIQSASPDELPGIMEKIQSGEIDFKFHAKGAVFSKPTLLGGNNIVGEAGAEAVAPIDVLQGYVRTAVADANTMQNDRIASVMENISAMLEQVVPFIKNGQTIRLNDREFARAVRSVNA